MVELHINEYGFGNVRIGNCLFTVLEAGGLWNLRCQDYSNKYMVDTWLVENKKRLSTLQKCADRFGIKLVQD